MDEDQIHSSSDELIDSYIREELLEKESDLFERHLLTCLECRIELSERARIVEAIQHISAVDTYQDLSGATKRSKKRKLILGLVAAAVTSLLLIVLLEQFRSQPATPSPTFVETKEDPLEVLDAINKKTTKITESKADVQIAYVAEFENNPVYESLIGIHSRNGNIVVESPADSMICSPGSSVEFGFISESSDSLFFALLNNKGEVLFEQRIVSPHIQTLTVPEGLYYWQLTNADEALHTAKIYIR